MRRLTPLWIFAIIFLMSVIYLPSLSKYLSLKRKENQLVDDIDKLQKQINDLKKEENLLKTNQARLEEVVREELGLVKPGEVVYKIVEEEPDTKSPDSTEKSSPVKTEPKKEVEHSSQSF